MPEPRFRPGQIVVLRRGARGFGSEPFEILRIQPDDGDRVLYRIRETRGLQERVVAESELMRAPSEPPRQPLPGRRPTR